MKITIDDAGKLIELCDRVLFEAGAFAVAPRRGAEKPAAGTMALDDLVAHLVLDENVSFDKTDIIENDVALKLWLQRLGQTHTPLPNKIQYPTFPVRTRFLGAGDQWVAWTTVREGDPRLKKVQR